LTECKK
jgi:hypothetical protein